MQAELETADAERSHSTICFLNLDEPLETVNQKQIANTVPVVGKLVSSLDRSIQDRKELQCNYLLCKLKLESATTNINSFNCINLKLNY
jgi:hypothetical protein